MDVELAKEILPEILLSDVKPEDIDEDNIVSISNMSGDLDYFIRQHSIKEEKINTMKNEIETLTNEVNKVNNEHNKLQKENEELKQNNKSKDDEIKNYKYNELKYKQKEIERNKKDLKNAKNFRKFMILAFFIFLCICGYLAEK
ncbi:hypothetical protein EXG18_10605, partial [Campylobacter coli]|nr:hypothetical protein [Campylobacter coli]